MTTSVSPDARRLWQASRGPVLIVLLIVATGIGMALVKGGGEGGSTDPRSVNPSGSRALARLLEGRGVRIELVQTADAADNALAGAPATLLITQPAWLLPDRLAELGKQAEDLVLVAPPEDALRALDLPVRVLGENSVADREPGCAVEAASVAGVARMGGVHYESTSERATTCYSGALVRVGGVALLGTGVPLTNDALDDQGDAALAMRLLGQHERLIWYIPSLADTVARPNQRELIDLLPDGWRFGALQVAIAAGVFALWRARRLGPVVTEPLPVVVRAAETVEGRARLYRRTGAAHHAADALRQAVRTQLIPRLGLPRDALPGAVADAVATRTGRPAVAVHDLLYGPPPGHDADLVRLADALDALEHEIGRR